jgi:hypothetical protein
VVANAHALDRPPDSPREQLAPDATTAVSRVHVAEEVGTVDANLGGRVQDVHPSDELAAEHRHPDVVDRIDRVVVEDLADRVDRHHLVDAIVDGGPVRQRAHVVELIGSHRAELDARGHLATLSEPEESIDGRRVELVEPCGAPPGCC